MNSEAELAGALMNGHITARHPPSAKPAWPHHWRHGGRHPHRSNAIGQFANIGAQA
jgi:hypothetical protein